MFIHNNVNSNNSKAIYYFPNKRHKLQSMVLSCKEKIIPLLITSIIITGSPPWFIWSASNQIKFSLVFLLILAIRNRLRDYSLTIWFTLAYLLIPIFIILPLFRGWHGSGIVYCLCFLCACKIRMWEYSKALEYTTKLLAVIIIITLPIWLIHMFIYQLPQYSIIDISEMKGTPTFMINYIFFVAIQGVDYFRFYSVFDEPGVLGTLGAFLLYANKYNLKKWENWSILAGGFFAYSMAFFVLTFVGFLIIGYRKKKNAIFTVMLLLPVVMFVSNFLRDDPAFQQAVMSRIFDSDASELVENRTSDNVDKTYRQMMTCHNAIYGFGNNYIMNKSLIEGASYKLFLLEYGIAGLITMLIIYRILMRHRDSIYSWGAYILIFASFLQRPQIWTDQMMLVFGCMIAGVTGIYQRTAKRLPNY